MTLTNWPNTLPQTFQTNGFSMVPKSSILRTDMDSGPAKVRRISTGDWFEYSGEFVMSSTQVNVFIQFVNTTLYGGTGTFNFPNPLNPSQDVEVRLLIPSNEAPYTLNPDGETGDWVIGLVVETI